MSAVVDGRALIDENKTNRGQIVKNVLILDSSLKWFACFVSISEQLTMFRSSLVRNSKGVCFNSETTIEEKVQEIDEDTWPFIFAAKSECTTYNMVSKLILEQSPILRLKIGQKRFDKY